MKVRKGDNGQTVVQRLVTNTHLELATRLQPYINQARAMTPFMFVLRSTSHVHNFILDKGIDGS